MMGHKKRVGYVRRFLEEKKLDCIITTNPSNIFYLTGIHGTEGYLCIDKKNINFFTSGIYYQYSLDMEKKLNIGNFSIEKIEKENFIRFISSFKKPALIASEISFHRWKTLSQKISGRLKTIDDIVLRMRMIKEPEEVLKIKKSLKIAKNIMEDLRKIIKPGISEIDISAEIIYKIRKSADREAFAPIVASGVNSSYPHHFPGKRKLKENDVVVVDMGVCIEGYNSDITETFFIGKIHKDVSGVLNSINRVHSDVEAMIKAGENSCKKIHQSAVCIFRKSGLEKFFVHSLGHGIGIDVHELPSFSESSKDKIEKAMVFTIEPGIYLPGKFGIRIEKMYFTPVS